MHNTKNCIVLLIAFLLVVLTASSASASVDPTIKLNSAARRLLSRTVFNIPQLKPNSLSVMCLDDEAQCGIERPKKTAIIVPLPLPRPINLPPDGLNEHADRIPLGVPRLAPMAYSMFCLRYPKDCKVKKVAWSHPFELTPTRWQNLIKVNAEVNRSITWKRNTLGLAGEKWLIDPKTGDCNDYAVTKRHDLLARGWPSRMLLLAEVVTRWGEHHLILVVRTEKGDFVLDSLSGQIRLWSRVPYDWVRVQSPKNPMWWTAVLSPEA